MAQVPILDVEKEHDFPRHCPICFAKTKWLVSGRGKHVIQRCEEHGFIGIRKNPLFKSEVETPRTFSEFFRRKKESFIRFLHHAL
jgi:hypothetical protein